MIRNLRVLLHCSLFALMPLMANASADYYTYNGTIQRNYGSYNNVYGDNPFYNYGVYNQHAIQGPGCKNGNCTKNRNAGMPNYTQKAATQADSGKEQSEQYSRVTESPYVNNVPSRGFKLDAGLAHQFASWKFDMATAGSKLHYDNLHWNVLDVSGKYDFDVDGTGLRVEAGLQYGLQYGDSPMVDDDISGGGYFLQDWYVDVNNSTEWDAGDQIWSQQGHAMSVGTSSDGDMLGIHAGVGLVDAWRVGNLRFTPSVGYRYLKYKLETKRNYGISLDTVSGADNYCQSAGGETQCLPFLVFVDSTNNPLLGTIGPVYVAQDGTLNTEGNGEFVTVSYVSVPSGAQFLETENTYYYYQDGISHSYEVEWSGPYLALDMQYDISANDAVNARVELGLPAYTASADQPYRPDWQHPKSLEDNGGIGDAYHFGFLANWLHSITDSVMLSVGMTFDYYSVSKADATSYLNPSYYNTYYYVPAQTTNQTLVGIYGTENVDQWIGQPGRDLVNDQALYINNESTMNYIDSMRAQGWKQEAKDEIDSLYKSIGIRVGIQAKF
ncbi:MAG: hypothetical protein J5608_02650 [Alphaproteobacteria bacterium]|nr:hypothetical protein [Alphaproteobacteria bacterium]